MFFFLFTAGSDSKDLGSIRATTCPNCNNTREWHLYRHRTKAGAFFLNLLTVKTRYVLACPICQYGEELDKTQAENLIRATRSPQDRDSG
jgi:hypothetical protein